MRSALVMALVAGCATAPLAPVDGAVACEPERAALESSGTIDDRGGAVSARAGRAYAYLSVRPGALATRFRVTLIVEETPAGYSVATSPELSLDAPAELRLDGARVTSDGLEVATRSLPGAIVVDLARLGERYDVEW